MTYNPTWGAGGGGGGGGGVTVIDFGPFPGSNNALVAFADTGVTASSKVSASIVGNGSTSDHSADDHRFASSLIGLSCVISAGVGGTIYASSLEKMQGQWAVQWQRT